MSYIPDYRSKENEAQLNDIDSAFLRGYRYAMKCAKRFLEGPFDYEPSETEQEVLDDLNEAFDEFADADEQETVCSIFESAEYIPDDARIIDISDPLYKNTKGAKG